MPASICKAIDFTIDEGKVKDELKNIASQILSESIFDDSTIEAGYLSGERFGLSVIDVPAKHDLSQVNLNQNSVILITGGARGITAEIAFELAKHYKPTLILIGRSQLPGKEDPRYNALTGARELKAKIIELIREDGKPVSIPHVEAEYKKLVKDREIRNNINKLEATTGKVVYHNLDVRDSQALTQLIEDIYKEYGKIDAVIHSAGIIEDALIKDKDTESFCRVFDTKVSSALTLLNSLKLDSLQYLFLFSSVVSRTGNAGQSDYVAANEVLNKLALAAQSKMSGRAASIMWGPWRGGMAQPELEEIFAQYGWSMIGVPAGCNVFLNELLCLQKTESEMLFVAELIDQNKRQAAGARLHQAELLVNGNGSGNRYEYIFELDPQQVDVFLQDHAFGGVPVVPMAYAIELMCEAVCSTYPDLPLRMLENCEIMAGILFDSLKKKISIVVQEEEKVPNRAAGQISIITGTHKRTENYKASYVMGGDVSLPAPSSGIPATCSFDPQINQSKPNRVEAEQVRLELGTPTTLPPLDEIFRKWLFQGPSFLGIKTINAAGEHGIWGRVSGLNPERCLQLPPSENWAIDPVMFDSALQLAGIWARHRVNMIALPTGFRRFTCFMKPDCQPGEIFTACVLVSSGPSANEFTCDLAVYKQSGELCLLLERLSGIDSKSLQRLASQTVPNTIEARI